jgi:hypothetical protein
VIHKQNEIYIKLLNATNCDIYCAALTPQATDYTYSRFLIGSDPS